MNLKQLIKKGCDNNLICYDMDAKKGVLSLRLICLMKTIARRNEGYGQIVKFIIPWGTQVDDGFANKIKKHNLEFELSVDYTGLYNDYGGGLPKGKSHCLISVCENGNILLGAY